MWSKSEQGRDYIRSKQNEKTTLVLPHTIENARDKDQIRGRIVNIKMTEVRMLNQKFSAPVFLVLSGLGNYCADSAWECFEYLDLHWPAARTADYRRVKALCRAAIDGVVPAAVGRRAMVILARRHGLLAAGPGEITGQRPAAYRFVPKRASTGPLGREVAAALAAGARSRTKPGTVTGSRSVTIPRSVTIQ